MSRSSEGDPARASGSGFWEPALDLYETRTGWLLKYDLAGVYPEDVRVRREGCRITLEGVRRDRTGCETGTRYTMEIAYHRFERTIELPCEPADPEIRVSVDHGFLFIHVRVTREGGEHA